MNVVSILRDARHAGVKLWLKDGQLAVQAKGGVPDDLLARIKSNKQNIINWLAQISDDVAAQSDVISPRLHNGPAPMSYSQSRLWVIDHMDAAVGLYNVPILLDLDGPLDVEKLGHSVSLLVERHQVLRTKFVQIDTEIMQVPTPHEPLVPTFTDLSGNVDQDEILTRLTLCDASEKFDLATDLMLRAHIVRLGPERHRLIMVLHHIITDGWSNQVLLTELIQTYMGAELPPVPLQFDDYAVWQRDNLETRGAALADWWAATLDGAPTLHELPTDFARPPVSSSAGARHFAPLPDGLTQQLRTLASTQGVSMYQLMLTAFSVFLNRQSGAADMIIGTPVAGRERDELKSVIGLLTNILPLRLQPDPTEGFSLFLRRSVTNINAAFSHQDIPFEMIVEKINPKRSLSHEPLTQIAFTLVQDDPVEIPEGPLTLTHVNTDLTPAKFELSLAVGDLGEVIRLDWAYATDLFSAETMERYHTAFVSLLQGIVDAPDTVLADLPMVSPQDVQHLLDLGSGTMIDYGPTVKTAFEMIEAQADKTPDKPALTINDVSISFGKMNRHANRIAHHLLRSGLGAGDCVGIATGAGPLMIIAALAANKAGAAFVQLPIGAPIARVKTILADCDARFVLTTTQVGYAAHLTDAWDIDQSGSWDDAPDTNPQSARSALCYVVYTSGTTGTPKGAMNSHTGLSNMCLWKARAFSVDQNTIHTVAADPSFDALNWEIWPTLTQGGTLAFLPANDLLDVDLLQAQIDRIAPTHFWLPTGLMEAMCASGLTLPPSVKLVATGGDRLQNYCLPRGCGIPLHNIYGPSEAAVITVAAKLTESDNSHDAPIGYPADNTICYVMDDQGRLLPRGAVGEICVSGSFLGQGYINRPVLTAEKYIPNPFSRPGHEVLYRTGDLGRWRADGQLECQGRNDFQVKIRGYRIEPQEVASVLLDLSGVHAAFVDIAHAGAQHLIAYCVPDPDTDYLALENTAREKLAALLPSYMLPEKYLWLDHLPLTERGKIDRKALAKQHSEMNEQVQVNTTSPRDTIELRLIDIWSGILVHRAIGLRDNFFDVGGNSLSAIKTMHDVNAHFGTKLPTTDLIAHPTIEALGAVIRAVKSGGGNTTATNPICFRKGAGEKNVICIHPGGGTAFGYMALAQALPADYGVWGVQSVGVEPGDAFLPDIGAMADHYIEICAHLLGKPFVVTGASFGGMISYEIVRRLKAAGNDMGTAVLLDAMGSDDPAVQLDDKVSDIVEFRKKLVTYNGMYPGIDTAQISQYHALYNHNTLCSRRWNFRKTDGRTVLIQAIAGRSKAQLLFLRFFWKQRCKGAFLFKCTAGDHSTILGHPDIQRVSKVIDLVLQDRLLPRLAAR